MGASVVRWWSKFKKWSQRGRSRGACFTSPCGVCESVFTLLGRASSNYASQHLHTRRQQLALSVVAKSSHFVALRSQPSLNLVLCTESCSALPLPARHDAQAPQSFVQAEVLSLDPSVSLHCYTTTFLYYTLHKTSPTALRHTLVIYRLRHPASSVLPKETASGEGFVWNASSVIAFAPQSRTGRHSTCCQHIAWPQEATT